MSDCAACGRHPAAWTALAYAVGLVAARALSLSGGMLAGLVAILVAVTLWVVGRRGEALLLVLALTGALRYLTCTLLTPEHHIRRTRAFGAQVRIRGTVRGEPQVDETRMRLVLDLQQLQHHEGVQAVCGRVLVTLPAHMVAADGGDLLVLAGRLQQPRQQRNPGGFDQRSYLRQQGVDGTLRVRRRSQIILWQARPVSLLHSWLVQPVQHSVRCSVHRHLRGASAALVLGMLLGDKQGIPAAVRDAFRAAGLAHVLVISGLHVGLLAFFFYLLLTLVACGERLACFATMVALVIYALVTGMQPTVIRAVIMACVVLGGRALGRHGDVYNSLGLAALIILGVWPLSLFGLSFQLSFAATLAIVGLHGPLLALVARGRLGDWWPLRTYVIAPLCVSLAAQLGTGPLIACYFQQLSPLASLFNLLVVPLISGVVGLGLLTALSGVIFPYAVLPISACNSVLLGVILRLVPLLASMPGASIPVARPQPGFLLWSALLVVLGARSACSQRARRGLVFAFLLGGNALVWGHVLGRPGIEIVCLDVGQGDAIFLRFANGRTLLVDGGDRTPDFDYGEHVLLPFLRSRGVRRLDVVVGTHPHSDHIGGLIRVLAQVQVGMYLDSGQYSESWVATRLREVITARGIRYHSVSAGDSLAGLGDAGILVLHPSPAFVSLDGRAPYNLNNGSVVLRVSWEGGTLLLTGDVEAEAERRMLAWGPRLDVDILKVAHHGSSTSSTLGFLAAVDPCLTLVSVGACNHFGHPGAEVMRRLADFGAAPLRTDQRGAILLRGDAAGMEIRTMVSVGRERPDGGGSPERRNVIAKGCLSTSIVVAAER